MTQHTPTPWINDRGTIRPRRMTDSTSNLNQAIAECHVYDQATNRIGGAERDGNAAFIVKACNEHEKLIHELRMADGLLRDLLNFKWQEPDDEHLRECVNERIAAIEPLITE